MSKANTRVIDLPEQTQPTGEEVTYIATENEDLKISLAGIRNFNAKIFAQKSANLSDLEDKEASRINLGVYSREQIDANNTARDKKISDIETINTSQNTEIEEIKSKNIKQDERLENIENLNDSQNVEIGKIKDINTEQNEKIGQLETKSTKIGGKVTRIETELTEKIDASEVENNYANKTHNHTTSEISDYNTATYNIIKNKIIAGQNVTITEEDEKLKITATGGGNGGGGGDMLKSIYDQDNDGKVNSAMVADSANSVAWNNIQNKPTTFTPSTHTHTIDNVTGLQSVLDSKVNAETGKGLSSNDYTTADKEKLSTLETHLNNKQKLFLNATSTNAIADVAKVATASRSPEIGDIVVVKYNNGTNSTNMTLNINNSGAKKVRIQNIDANGAIHRVNAGGYILYYYDGSFYHMIGSQFNSLYSNISVAEAKAGTATTSRYVTAQILAEMAKRKNHSGTQAISTVTGLQDELNKMTKTDVTNLFTTKQRFGTTMNNDDYYVEIDNNIPGIKMGGGDCADCSIRAYEYGIMHSINGESVMDIKHDGIYTNKPQPLGGNALIRRDFLENKLLQLPGYYASTVDIASLLRYGVARDKFIEKIEFFNKEELKILLGRFSSYPGIKKTEVYNDNVANNNNIMAGDTPKIIFHASGYYHTAGHGIQYRYNGKIVDKIGIYRPIKVTEDTVDFVTPNGTTVSEIGDGYLASVAFYL